MTRSDTGNASFAASPSASGGLQRDGCDVSATNVVSDLLVGCNNARTLTKERAIEGHSCSTSKSARVE